MFDRLRRRLGFQAKSDPARPSTADRGRTVLVEYPSFGTPGVLVDVLERAGYDTIVCSGPGDMTGVCHLLETGDCPWADAADAVFNGFGLGTDEHRRIIEALRREHPDTPVVVEATPPQAEAHADVVAGCLRCDTPLTSGKLLAAVEEALTQRDRTTVH